MSFGLERNVYITSVNLQTAGWYKFSSTINARTPTVNIQGQPQLYIETEIQHTMGVANGGVKFITEPIYSSSSNSFSATNLAQHPLADSVIHEYVIPRSIATTNTVFTPFFQVNQNQRNVDPVLNPITGQLVTEGNNPIVGNYAYAIKATAFKNGVPIGVSTRENAYVPNYLTEVSADSIKMHKPSTTLDLGSRGKGYLAQRGVSLNLDSLVLDYWDVGKTIFNLSNSVHAATEITTSAGIKLGTNAFFTDTIIDINKRRFNFTYTPDSADGNSFQVVNFRVSDQYAAYDQSFWIYVEGDTTLKYQGADISVNKDSLGVTKLYLNLYHDPSTVLDATQRVYLKDAFGNVTSYNADNKNTQVISTNPSIVLVTNFESDLANLAAGTYTAYVQECCRLNNLLNVASATDNGFYIETQFTINNSLKGSPKFNYDPVTAVPKDTLWGYDISTTDLDGDSIYYSVSAPLQAAGNAVNQYVLLPSNSLLNLQILQPVGIVSISGAVVGKYALNVKAESFDISGAKQDEINRDMFIEVFDTLPSLNVILPDSSIFAANGLPSFSLTAGKPFTFSVDAFTNLSTDSTAGLALLATGFPLILQSSAATFTVSLNKRGSGKKGTFTWTPDKSLKGQSFIVKIRAVDEQMSYTYAVQLNIDAAVSIDEQELSGLHVYPNPVKNVLNINFIEGGLYTMALVDEIGQVIYLKNISVNGDVTRMTLPADLTTGIYLLQITGSTKEYVQKIQIRK